jgi:hypothetical protein
MAERDIGIRSRRMILLQVTDEIATRPGFQCVFSKYNESQPYAL